LLGLFALLGCKSQSWVCPTDNLVQNVCAGVPPDDPASCRSSGPCANPVDVADDAALQAAIANAQKGTCIALAPGQYGEVTLPAGVSLTGTSVADVTVQGVTLAPGDGAHLCGLLVGASGVQIQGATNVAIDSVRVSGSAGVGIDAAPGSTVTITRSEIVGSGSHGLTALGATDSTSIALDQTVITGSSGAGLWMQCQAACGCAAQLTAKTSVVHDNHVVGLSLVGITASMDVVDVGRTLPGDKTNTGQYGGGLSITGCANASATNLAVHDNASFGVLVDGASATFGNTTGDGADISGNLMGLWIQNVSVTQTVHLENGNLEGNRGVGIGVSGGSHGIIICRSKVSSTVSQALPVGGGGVKEVGDGLNWLDGSEVTIEDLTLSGNARASLLIDGSAHGTLTNVTLAGGDESKGILQQNFPAGGSQPGVTNSPPITTTAGAMFALPLSPSFAAMP
jgi:hypothetical protein